MLILDYDCCENLSTSTNISHVEAILCLAIIIVYFKKWVLKVGRFHSITKVKRLKNQKCKRVALFLKTDSNTTKIKLSENVYSLSEPSPALYYFYRSIFNSFVDKIYQNNSLLLENNDNKSYYVRLMKSIFG